MSILGPVGLGGRRVELFRRRLCGVAKLLGTLLLTFLGLLLVTFLIGRVVPVDPVLAAVGDRASAEVYEQAKRELGLDRPLYEQFAVYVWDVLRGDLGKSVLTARPVAEWTPESLMEEAIGA